MVQIQLENIVVLGAVQVLGKIHPDSLNMLVVFILRYPYKNKYQLTYSFITFFFSF